MPYDSDFTQCKLFQIPQKRGQRARTITGFDAVNVRLRALAIRAATQGFSAINL